MTDLNIDDFYHDTAKVLELLYRSFPRPLAIYVSDISGPDEPDEYGVHSDRHMACFSAFLWLANEGYIRYDDNIQQDAIDQAVLTATCFTLLSTPSQNLSTPEEQTLPESVQMEHASNIHRIRQALRSHSSIKIGMIVAQLMNAMLGNRTH